MPEGTLRTLEKIRAMILHSHVVYPGELHGTVHIDANAIYPHARETSRLCRRVAEQFINDEIEVVVAPAIGGAIISQWIAYHLSELGSREVLSVYAEKEKKSPLSWWKQSLSWLLKQILRSKKKEERPFTIKHGYNQFVTGKNVLVVGTVVPAGDPTMKKVVDAVRAIEGNVVGLGILCNLGGITPQYSASVPKFFALVDANPLLWDELTCPFCQRDVPLSAIMGEEHPLPHITK